MSERIDLQGAWRLKLGNYEKGGHFFDEECMLPGTLDENKKGSVNTELTINRLNRKYIYTGAAVYERVINIPKEAGNKRVILVMERTKMTRVWLNDILQQTCFGTSADTLGTEQIYYLSGAKAGADNVLTIEVTNDNYPVGTGCHMLTEETVTNWNGIIGEFYIEILPPVGIERLRLYPDIHKHQVAVKADIYNDLSFEGEALLEINCVSKKQYALKLNGAGRQTAEVYYDMGEAVKLWSEFEPALYTLQAQLSLDAGGEVLEHTVTERFGMREFSSSERKFAINGIKTFLRGEGNSAVFPLTGYPYMKKEEWLEFFNKAKAMGINFFRFHSWTPPRQAFAAADELGIYMQPELYAFGGAPFKPEKDDDLTAKYYKDEAVRILRTLASHPSFVMMAWGNELDTYSSDNRGYAKAFKKFCETEDGTRLYAEGSNNNFWEPSFNEDDDYWTTCKTHSTAQKDQIRISFSWVDDDRAGLIETLAPNTEFNFDGALAGYEKPVMSHETGQYQTLPYFEKEIPKYDKGIFEARNLKHYQDVMKNHGLLEMNEIFSKVSARVSAIGYRADIETSLRSHDLAGYQLLSIQDFPGQGTAHVGMLDNFMEEKPGGFTKAQYANFNQPAVVLALLPKLIYTTTEKISARAAVVNYTPSKMEDVDIFWKLENGCELIDEGCIKLSEAAQGTVTKSESFSCDLSKIRGNQKLLLTVGSEKIGNENSYEIWAYPEIDAQPAADCVTVCEKWDDDTKKILLDGGSVLLLPTPDIRVLPESVAVRFTTDYWSRMFHRSDRDAHTMGMYVQKEHPVFDNFVTDEYNDYQWFNLMKGSRAIIMDELPSDIRPLAWNIDHMEWGRKLGSLFEVQVGGGKLMVCTFDLKKQRCIYPEAAQLYKSIMTYMSSEAFQPEVSVDIQSLDKVIACEEECRNGYEFIQAADYDSASVGVFKKNSGICGMPSGYSAVFKKIDFGEKGADSIVLEGETSHQKPVLVEIYNEETGKKIAETSFEEGSEKKQTIPIQRQTGIKTVKIKVSSDSFVFNGFCFEETSLTYMNPYKQLDPESVAADTVIIDGEGGSHRVMQNYVGEISGSVSVIFNRVDFGENGSLSAILKGRTTKNQTVKGYITCLCEDENGQKTEAGHYPFTFEPNMGEAYELSSETFYKQCFEAKGILGVQNLKVVFDKDTGFEFESLTFVENQGEVL